jgi:hypothetical protein
VPCQRDAQAVSEKGNEDVGLDARLELLKQLKLELPAQLPPLITAASAPPL